MIEIPMNGILTVPNLTQSVHMYHVVLIEIMIAGYCLGEKSEIIRII